jgi:hypothetical protein
VGAVPQKVSHQIWYCEAALLDVASNHSFWLGNRTSMISANINASATVRSPSPTRKGDGRKLKGAKPD